MKSLITMVFLLWTSVANGAEAYPFFDISVPNAVYTAAFGINDKGDVVAYWFVDDPTSPTTVKITGFVRKVGKLNPVDIIPLRINTDGVIVGLSGAGNDGAILEDGIVTLIKVPGADYSQIHGINDKGAIVSYYTKAGVNYGFVRTGTKK